MQDANKYLENHIAEHNKRFSKQPLSYLSATKDLATKEIVAFNVSKDLSMQTAFIGLEETLKQKDCSKVSSVFYK